jgi:hypothetical protein
VFRSASSADATSSAGDHSNWFGPNIRAVLDSLESAGFEAELTKTWGRGPSARRRGPGVPESLAHRQNEPTDEVRKSAGF